MLASSAAAKTLLMRSALARSFRASAPAVSSIGATRAASLDGYGDYGKHLFKGSVADDYLKRHGASATLLDDPSWTETSADIVAAAVLDW